MVKTKIMLLSFILVLLTSFTVSSTVTQSDIYPSDGAANVWVKEDQILVTLATDLGHVMNCTISLYKGSTLIDTETKSGIENSTRTLNITSTLDPSTVYTIYVNANDVAVTGWANETYTFTTGMARLSENTVFTPVEIIIFGLFAIFLLLFMVYTIIQDIKQKTKIDLSYLINRLIFYMIMVIIIGIALAFI